MENEPQRRKSAFVSYAHRDAWDFVRRLTFALGLYADVFWDRRLPAGPFPENLYSEIEGRDFFLFVMTPSSLESEWCRKELEHAQQQKKEDSIIPICLFDECVDPTLREDNYARFATDFEQGFRGLTKMMFDQPYSSWERLGQQKNAKVIASIGEGLIPGLISRSVAEWVIVEKVWAYVEEYIGTRQEAAIFRGLPRTPLGILQQCQMLKKQFGEDQNNIVGFKVAEDAGKIAEIFVTSMMRLTDEQNTELGRLTLEIIQNAKRYLMQYSGAFLDAIALANTRGFFDFDVAEKTRELINMHARRSRYLY